MPVYRYIDDFTAADSYTVIRSMDPLNSNQPITSAWFTVKSSTTDNDSMALINVVITTITTTPGFVNNYPDGTALLTFYIQPPLSEKLQPSQTYYYDICIASATDERYTVEEGKLFTTRYVRQVLA